MRRSLFRCLPPLALAAALSVLPAAAADAAPAAPSLCGGSKDAALLARLDAGLRAALQGRGGTISAGLQDPRTGTWCGVGIDRHFDSASTVKATVMAAVLRRAQEQGRSLTADENRLVTAAITRSDNDATTALWNALGTARVKAFLKLAGMTHTTLDPGGRWGLTQITVRDELRLLSLFDTRNAVLTDASRAYALRTMGAVIASQRWGTPAGLPAWTSARLKNGWLPRATLGWRVHSIGDFARGAYAYRIVVLTHGNTTMQYGVDSIERVARAFHDGLAPLGTRVGTPAPARPAATAALLRWSAGDGSAPQR